MRLIALLICFLYTSLTKAQISGDFNSPSSFIEFSYKTFNDIVDITPLADGSSIILLSSYDLNNGFFEYDTRLIKITSNGTLDTSFGTNGIATINLGTFENIIPVKIQMNEGGDFYVLTNILSIGLSTRQFTSVSKVTATGTLDPSFGNDGHTILTTAFNVSNFGRDFILTDNKIGVASSVINPDEEFDEFPVIFQLTLTGELDLSFNNTGYRILPTLIPNASLRTTRINHIAGGFITTITTDNQSNYLVAGRIANLVETDLFILKLDKQGNDITSFFNNGYYFPSNEGFIFEGFKRVFTASNGDILYSLSTKGEDRDITLGILSENNFSTQSIDFQNQQDIIENLIEGSNNQLFAIGRSFNSEFIELSQRADQNVIFRLNLDDKQTRFQFIMDLDTESDFELMNGAFSSFNESLFLSGRIYAENNIDYSAFLNLTAEALVAVEPEVTAEDFNVFPIPFSNSLFLDSDLKIEQINLLSWEGNLLETLAITDSNKILLNNKLADGIYFLTIITSNGSFNKKIIHQQTSK